MTSIESLHPEVKRMLRQYKRSAARAASARGALRAHVIVAMLRREPRFHIHAVRSPAIARARGHRPRKQRDRAEATSSSDGADNPPGPRSRSSVLYSPSRTFEVLS